MQDMIKCISSQYSSYAIFINKTQDFGMNSLEKTEASTSSLIGTTYNLEKEETFTNVAPVQHKIKNMTLNRLCIIQNMPFREKNFPRNISY